MKKIICFITVLTMLTTMIGCSKRSSEGFTEDSKSVSSEESKPPLTGESESALSEESESASSEESESASSEESESALSEESESALTEESKSDPSNESTSTDSSKSKTEGSDITDFIDAAATSEDNVAKLNQWVKTARYATEDKTYHTVYVRITKVTTQTNDSAYVQSAIDLHNTNSYDFQQIDTSTLELPSDIELCILDYEVFVPADFPSADYGIVEPNISFSQSNIGGGGFPSADGTSTYIGLGAYTEDLSTEKDPEYQPGNTYKLRGLYTMVKDYENYVLNFTTYPEGTVDTSADIMYDVYFSRK